MEATVIETMQLVKDAGNTEEWTTSSLHRHGALLLPLPLAVGPGELRSLKLILLCATQNQSASNNHLLLGMQNGTKQSNKSSKSKMQYDPANLFLDIHLRGETQVHTKTKAQMSKEHSTQMPIN